MSWQPIETAPKDGTEILIFEPGEPFWNGSPCHWIDVARWGSLSMDLGEYGWLSQSGGLSCDSPTHWMPLPAPPKESER